VKWKTCWVFFLVYAKATARVANNFLFVVGIGRACTCQVSILPLPDIKFGFKQRQPQGSPITFSLLLELAGLALACYQIWF